ncbi:acyl-CoA dehydrogenase [Janthinobacterium agaricidamnosum]|uniref:Acyl-CoA dehydrogenase, middle domain protein n=1 Tax=Janthinobacterium agaricidamnosum NBRC 102515 = DSM 9628 TaxID=1349767 RepID=W0V6T7_9BURK|nr:acyl-CoA dehydrogenase [Janthinobacterium agaricidamnosum]CDG83063.1 acyl-CoA dehydrogenase, middle domain protein [Janthinobacterium agaricidamnosum NBRC 102515 = DSM 9628]
MQSTILSRRDIDFMLYEWLQVEALTDRPRFQDHSRETFDAAIDTAEQIASELFAPHNKKSDQQEPRVVDGAVVIIPEVKTALDAFSAAGLMAAGQDYELGGMQLPVVLEKTLSAYFTAANVATASYTFLTVSNANTLLTCGTPLQVERFVKPMFDGKFFGTMCLSEPQAGSSLSDIATRAEPDPADGPEGERQYRLSGNKMWISGGEHNLAGNIVHLVLAKIPGPDGRLIPGVKGISLFIVPKFLVEADGALGERNDVVLAGLNHKMGHRGTSNCLLNFGEGKFQPQGKGGAIGYLVGQPHQGLANMFHMMNEARIAVGLGAAVLGYTGYLHALDYARNRPQGRHPAAKDPAQPQIAIIGHTDVRRMLLAQKAYVEGGLGLVLYSASLVDEARSAETPQARAKANRLLDFLTPVTKSWPSQWCLEANSLAIQVHGGYGYTREYNVEQFYRDNRLNAIHEGTHGIHGLDLLGRKVVIQDGALFNTFGDEIAATVDQARSAAGLPAPLRAELQGHASLLESTWKRVGQVTRGLYAVDDMNRTLANASVYLEAVGHVVVAWIWLRQGLLAAGRDDDFYRGKVQACRYFFHWELPKVQQQLDLLESVDTTTLDMQDAWF